MQSTFAELEYSSKKSKTWREKFLERMDRLIPWQELEDRIRPHYLKARRGRRPHPLSLTLRVHCVQLFCNASDPGMEDMLCKRTARKSGRRRRRCGRRRSIRSSM